VVDAAHIDGDYIALDLDIGLVLLAAGFNGVGDEFVHGLAAAHGLDAGIIDHLYDIAAVGADVKLAVLHNI